MLVSSFFYAAVVGILPSLIWLFFWLREDTHAQPRSLIAFLFFAGMFSVIIAGFTEKYISDVVADTNIQYALWAAVEELLKLMVVAILALHSTQNREPIDAMIYCIVVALGFAALENTFFIMDPLLNGEVTRGLITGNMRFIGSTLLHIISSASIGFAIGYVYYYGRLVKLAATCIGVIAAITIHFLFNISILNATTEQTLRTFGWIWGAVVLLIILFEEVKAVHMRKVQSGV